MAIDIDAVVAAMGRGLDKAREARAAENKCGGGNQPPLATDDGNQKKPPLSSENKPLSEAVATVAPVAANFERLGKETESESESAQKREALTKKKMVVTVATTTRTPTTSSNNISNLRCDFAVATGQNSSGNSVATAPPMATGGGSQPCQICGRFGSFGFGFDVRHPERTRWFCAEHREAGK